MPGAYVVAFLDFDGVVARFIPAASAFDRLVPERIAHLNTLVDKTGCRVVISSTWRKNPKTGLGLTASQLEGHLRRRGYTGTVHDITPTHEDVTFEDEIARVRGGEILAWCCDQKQKPRSIVVIDDVALQGPIGPYQVKTVETVGLTDADVARAIAILKRPLRGRRPWSPPRVAREAREMRLPAQMPFFPGLGAA